MRTGYFRTTVKDEGDEDEDEEDRKKPPRQIYPIATMTFLPRLAHTNPHSGNLHAKNPHAKNPQKCIQQT